MLVHQRVCFSTFPETYCNFFRETSFFGNVRAFIICNLGSHGNAEASLCLAHAWHRSKLFWRICKCHIFMVHFYNHMMRTQWSQKSKHISRLSWKLAPAKHSGNYLTLMTSYDITRSLACNPKCSFFWVQLDACEPCGMMWPNWLTGMSTGFFTSLYHQHKIPSGKLT